MCFVDHLTVVIHAYMHRCSGITGKAVTPFVLQRVNELTGGKSLKASIQTLNICCKMCTFGWED